MPKFLVRLMFVIGFFIGVLLAILLAKVQQSPVMYKIVFQHQTYNLYETWFSKQNLKRQVVPMDLLRYGGVTYMTESEFLSDKIRLLCVVLVRKVKYAKASILTWTRQCDDVNLVHIKRSKLLIRKNKAEAMWPVLCNTLLNTSKSFHWLLVTNDNTFSIIENIKYLVAPLNSSNQYYLGHAVKFWGVSYNSGDAGYLLSNGSLSAIKGNSNLCNSDTIMWNLEDYYLGKALGQLNISVSDTRDERGLAVFHGFNLQKLFFPGSTALSNYYKFSVYPPTVCCSSRSVTFQVSSSSSMFTYKYLLNQLQVFTNGTLGNRKAATAVSGDEVWKSVLKQHGRIDTNITAKEYYELWVDLVSDPISFAQKMKNNY
ncbi:hypothetical protein FQA39_LY06628 [Lamprigera yunnana]|nr:hypothetical protein FQA39_LY06628 [Lamprigera yunnana]